MLLPLKIAIEIFVCFFIFASLSYPFTEKDAVISALRQNTDIRILRLDTSVDSLLLEAVEAGRLPSINVEAAQEVYPYDSVKSSGFGKNAPSVSTILDVSAAQVLPGGGTLAGAVEQGLRRSINNDSIYYTTSIGITYTQPLLRNAWRQGELDYSIRIKRLDNKALTLQQRKLLLSHLSNIRNVYWLLYEKEALRTIFEDRKRYAEKYRNTEKMKYNIGKASILDTLSASFEYLEAARLLLAAQTDAKVVRQELALALCIERDTIIVDTAQPVELVALPDADDFMKMAQQFDPQLALYDVIAQKLNMRLSNNKNRFLPEVNFEAGYSRVASGDKMLGASNAYSGNAVIALLVRYSFPVKTKRTDKKQTGLQIQRNSLSMAQYTRELKYQIDELLLSWEQELEAITISIAAQEIARKKFEAAKAGYEIGTVDQLALEKAENDYVESTVRLLQKKVVMKKLEIIFDEITGNVFNRFGVKAE